MLQSGRKALVVDPGDAQPVLDYLQAHAVQLEGILITHHHADHTGGVDRLCKITGATVFGPSTDTMPEPLQRPCVGDGVDLHALYFQFLVVPGHTAGHITSACDGVEGVPAHMLAALPDTTQVCCTHEYTLSNLKFARMADTTNVALEQYQQQCLALRAAGQPILPSRIGVERAINPFLRSDTPAVIASVTRFDAQGVHSDGIFATLRRWKNQNP